MNIKMLCTLIFVVLFPFVSTAENKDEEKNSFLLQKGMAGKLKLGMSSKDLYSLFDKNMTEFIDLKLEGNYCPAIAIYLDDKKKEKPSLVAEITQKDDWKVWRIRVYDKRFKTKEGIGIGSTFGEIGKAYSKIYKLGWSHHREDQLCVAIRDLKLHFEIDITLQHGWYKDKNPDLIPDDTKILSVVVN